MKSNRVHQTLGGLGRACGFALFFSLFGCTAAPLRDAELIASLWQQHRAQVWRIESWRLHGRLSLATPDGSWTAGLRWQQEGERFRMRFTAPLGQGSYELTGGEREVTLRAAADRVYRAASAEMLLDQHLGWQVSLDGLRYWVRGLPDPRASSRAMRWDDAGRLVDMEQHGFRVSILRYQSQAGRAALPTKLFIHSDAVKLRLVIQRWEA